MAPKKNLNNTYISPTHPHLNPILIAVFLMTLSAVPTPSFLRPFSTTPPPGFSEPLPPTVAKALRWTQNGLFYLLYGAHSVETLVFMKRLRDHGISFASVAWWKWVVTCFFGGKFCF
ncbi:uncharacterized protein SETTUDRAFT_166396, partial [Exserohilum turcica Et28A]